MSRPWLIHERLRQDAPALLSVIAALPTEGLAKAAAGMLLAALGAGAGEDRGVAPIALGADRALFLYPSSKAGPREIALVGEWSRWRPAAQLGRVGRSHLFAAELSFPRDAWVIYKYIVDGAWETDPLNPRRIPAGGGAVNSLFTMPGFRIPEVLEPGGAGGRVDIPQGTTVDLGVLQGGGLAGGRRVRVHLPPGFDPAEGPLPSIYILDGEENLGRGRVGDALDRLAHGGIWRGVAIAMDHPGAERHLDYTPFFPESRVQAFADFVAEGVLPLVTERYGLSTARGDRAVWGQSFGGTGAFALGALLPEVFGRVAGQSGVYQWEEGAESIVDWYQRGVPEGTRFYLDSTHFGSEPRQSGAMAEVLMAARAPHIYWERGTHHGYEGWRWWLGDLLSFLFP